MTRITQFSCRLTHYGNQRRGLLSRLTDQKSLAAAYGEFPWVWASFGFQKMQQVKQDENCKFGNIKTITFLGLSSAKTKLFGYFLQGCMGIFQTRLTSTSYNHKTSQKWSFTLKSYPFIRFECEIKRTQICVFDLASRVVLKSIW